MTQRYSTFFDEKSALEEISSAGYFPVTLDFQEESSELHWHDFDSLVYVLQGEVQITDESTGEVYLCEPGTKISAPAGIVHREDTKGYKALIGFSIDPTTLSQPINKDPAVLAE